MVWIDEDPNAGQHDTGDQGHSHMATTNLFFARSTDGGRTFTTPVQFNRKEGDVWGFTVSTPRLAIGANGTIHVFYPGNDCNSANGKPHAVAMYTRSTDQGRSFDPPQRLNTMPTSDASHLVHGGLTHAHVFGTMAVSNDDGRSFGTDAELFPADVCPCCQLVAFVDDRDRLFVGSRQVEAGYRDSAIAVSADGGRAFLPRNRLSPNRWKIEGCPLKPTAVAASGDQIWAAYCSGGEPEPGVHFVRSTDGGKTYPVPLRVHPEASVSDAPVLALAGDTLHLFWHAKTGSSGRRIYTRASNNGGESFGPIQELPTPAGSAQLPVVAPRPDGTVQVAWQQGAEIHSLQWPQAAAQVAASARAPRPTLTATRS